jgi:hypothetical protein
MSRSLEELGLIHRTPPNPSATEPVPGPREGLLEAYKKHVEELRGIEDRQAGGGWMTQNYWIVLLVCAGFIGMLFFGKLG